MKKHFTRLLGLPALLVSIFVWGQTDDGEAGLFHHLPLLVNGAGYQSTLLVTNVADQANRCKLELLADGLSASSFETHESLTWNGLSATIDLPESGTRISISGRNLSPPEVYGSATLNCDLPVVARVLVTLSSVSLSLESKVVAAALLPSAQTGAIFKFPVLPELGGYLLAAHNVQGSGANCRVELANESGVVADEQPLSIAGNASVFRDLTELVQAPADFEGGSATVSCDGQIAATGLLAGAALSGLPPVVLSNDPTATGFAPVNTSAFDQFVVGKRFVSVDDSRYYIEFPSAGQFVEVEPGTRYSGTYSYSNTGPNTGTLTLNYSDGDTCTVQLTLTSTTTGSSQFTCTGGETGGGNLRLDDSQSPQTGGDNGGGDDTEVPMSPTNVRYIRDGSTTVLSWDSVAGADYYKIYHDDFFSSSCRLRSSGSLSFCHELAANVTGTSYTHANPDDENYYWVVACNSGGCSEIDSDNPAAFIDTRPAAPQNISYVRDGSTTVLSWDSVAGANYYKIYYDDFFDSSCRLNSLGSSSFCDELADNVTGTNYTHANPDFDENYYWVVACNSGGCSDINSDSPAEFIDTRPAAPENVRASRNGSSATLSWNAAAGADYYKIYHDDFWSSGCRLNSSGSPSFCDELAANVTGTSYTHANPDEDENYYWVVACNAGGCSDIDSDNPTVLNASGGNTGGGGDTGGGGNGGGGDPGACRAGLVVNPGENCTYNGFEFSVSSSGRGSIAFFSAGTGIDARGSTINGVAWNFHATKNAGSNSWTIHVAD